MKNLPMLLLLCVAVCSAYPLKGAARDGDDSMDLVQHYLEKYYNLAKDVKLFARRQDSSPVVRKIQEMQKFLGLKVTGKLNSDTLEVMQKPRCGVPDVGRFSTFPGMPRWRKTHLTYRIVDYTLDLPRDAVDSAIEKAVKVWEKVTPLTFSRIYEGEADIMITFAVRDHGDFYPFDGPGMVLAHAYPPGPGINGDAHFDDDEQWTKDTSGTNLFYVAAHELGHSLGLQHSANAEALMYPVYNTDLAQVRLSQDDVNGIQSLYGPPPTSPADPVVPTESVPPETPDMCDPTLSFDAVSTLRGEILFFKDRHFWRKSLRTLEPGFYLLSSFWPSLPSGIDAAYEVTSKDTVFIFKQNQFWAIRGNEVQAGYPRGIHTLGFPPTVRKIDAALFDKEKKKSYFFVEDKYWRFDEKKQSMDPGFPRQIVEDFPGIEPKVDAVFESFGFFYFFNGSSQLEFDPNAKKVTHVLKSNSWLNC
ncbi:matrix metallopeptidase 3 [Rhinolophus ferrumequinum]|uniref:Stromelysin-1 n=1 Tax=Rhinolophus ferrumequinum TaxID=59479 RepID=A0A671EDR8_RHIFE|nr:stromelysin-1-like [Rhinolophus ferrumequinum]KAF6333578.1 matrix metallopeptidase 3 [Rhinolophus ferrumequinum]